MTEHATEDFNQLYPNTRILEHEGKKIYLVGTAHISQKSVDEVEALIHAIQPDSVCVELCATRFKTLKESGAWQKLDIFQVIKQGKTLFLMANLALSSFQKRIGDQVGVLPGAEQMKAIQIAEQMGAKIILADRDVQVTLKRTWAAIPWSKKIMVLRELFTSLFQKVEISENDLEKLKDQDELSELMEDFARKLPQVKGPLINERDRYLAGKVAEAPGEKIIAVVGAGHVRGISKYLHEPCDFATLEIIPNPSRVAKSLKWVIPLLVLCAFYFGYQKHAGETFQDMLVAWILPNSILAMVFSLAAGAKFLSALTAFVASPITSLNPTLGAGMVVGLVEAWLRKPKVEDMLNISADTTTLGGWYRNPVTRTLMVAVFSTIGSALGALVGLSWLFAIWAK